MKSKINEKNKYIGFESMSKKEQAEVSAGNFSSFLKATIGFLSGGGLNAIFGVANNIMESVGKTKLYNKISHSPKGEIEIGREGQFKAKWDDISSSANSTVIF